jgi:cytochrome c-type biogenesis protein CcmH/NrfF
MSMKPTAISRLIPLTAALLLALGALDAAAQPAEAISQDDPRMVAASKRASELGDELRSPFCPGKTLKTCTSGQAFTARQEIRDRLLAGEAEEAILTDFQSRYGEDLRNPPQPWYTVVGPLLPVLVGVVVLVALTIRWRAGRRATPPPPAAPSSVEDDERLARLRARVAQSDD